MSCFALLPEIRLMVYGYAVNLNSSPFIDAQCLFLSCQQIHAEMDAEGKKLLRARYATIKKSLPFEAGILFDIPATFQQLRHLRISLATSASIPDVDPADLYFWDQLLVIMELHLDSPTLTFHEDNDVPSSSGNIYSLDADILVTAMHRTGVLHAQPLVIDPPLLIYQQPKKYVVAVVDCAKNQDVWREPDWIVELGPRTTLVFERIGSRKPVAFRYRRNHIFDGLMQARKATVGEIIAVRVMVGVVLLGCAVDVVKHFI